MVSSDFHRTSSNVANYSVGKISDLRENDVINLLVIKSDILSFELKLW